MRCKIQAPKIDRWSEGIDHEPESDALARLIGEVDFEHFDDSFCFRFGGDGDNGETLAYILDTLIENDLIKIEIMKK
ncbi:hypothetical protein UFOVP410_132 [uncultured Caudovirales phage]|uniref:Uncharacterized protein n=1 Tax=uncultured Caudovirales phage TaxID=2100421 RepID=A0A6J5M7C9_9CAUD|nr:hypothetical protein UFOVP410_132 [uncultured Caudovirales phage]